MIKNNKGLSTIVTTLILVLLVLVAVGILWNPVKNLLSESTDALENTDCMTIDLSIGASQATADTEDYTLTITRNDDGDNTIYVRMLAINATESGTSDDSTESWTFAGEKKTIQYTGSGITNTPTINVIPYFMSEETGQEVLCGAIPVDVLLA